MIEKRNEPTAIEDIHLCSTCRQEFAVCAAKRIVWGIDCDPYAQGADADKVLECDLYMNCVERKEKGGKG